MPQPKTYIDKNSTIYNLRLKRFEIFKSFLSDVKNTEGKETLNILDVGGTVKFWQVFNYSDVDYITVLNLTINGTSNSQKVKLIEGDATDLRQFKNNEFDVVFSNSVIEHVGNFNQQKKMSQEVRRVGKYFFIQTPNYYFPIEPHFRFPFFVHLPNGIKQYLVRHYQLRQKTKREVPLGPDKTQAIISSIRLLKKREFERLFPSSELICEKYYGLNKSFMCLSKL